MTNVTAHRRVLRIVYVIGLTFFGGATVLGIWQSFRQTARPPGLSLDYVQTIRRYIQADDLASAEREAAMAVALDHAMEHVAHTAMGSTLVAEGRLDEGIEHFRQAIDFQPSYADAQFGLAVALASKGEKLAGASDLEAASEVLNESVARFQRTLELRPGHEEATRYFPLAVETYAKTLVKLGRERTEQREFDRAIVAYRNATRLAPDDPAPHAYLAEILATHPDARIRKGHEAVRLAERARSLTKGQHPFALRALAAAYAETGQYELAVRSIDAAINASRVTGRADLVPQLQAQLALYQAGKPFRNTSWGSS
jgi:tetratricopeptide (TPR) repeat protein